MNSLVPGWSNRKPSAKMGLEELRKLIAMIVLSLARQTPIKAYGMVWRKPKGFREQLECNN